MPSMLSRAKFGRCRADCPICMWSHDRPTAWYRQGCREACGMRVCPRNIQRADRQKGRKGCGQWSVVSPRLRTDISTTRAVPSPPAPERSEIWLFEWAWGELCVELSVTATGELGAVVCWSCCSAEKDCLRCTSGCCHAAYRYCQRLPAAERRLPNSSARGVFTRRRRLVLPQARLLLSQGAVAAVPLGALDLA